MKISAKLAVSIVSSLFLLQLATTAHAGGSGGGNGGDEHQSPPPVQQPPPVVTPPSMTAEQQQGQGQGQAQQAAADASAKSAADAAAKATSNTNVGVGVTTGVSTNVKTGDSLSSAMGGAGGDSKSSSSASTGNVLSTVNTPTNVTTGPTTVNTPTSVTTGSTNVKSGDSTSSANGGAGGAGGTGVGGNSSLANSGNGGGATVDNSSGNGNGASVSTANTTNNSTRVSYLYVNLPTVPAAAPTMTGTGAIAVTSACGPLMEKVRKPIEYLIVGHFGTKTIKLEGQNSDTLEPVMDKDGKPAFETVDNGDGTTTVWGSIYTEAAIVVSSSVSKSFGIGGFGSSGGGNAANGIAGTITGTERIIALGRCEYRKYKVIAVAGPEKNLELTAPKTEVLAPTGKQVLVKESAKPALCNGQPIPEGYKCAFVRDKVSVVKDANLTNK